jgi:hypothetical protein
MVSQTLVEPVHSDLSEVVPSMSLFKLRQDKTRWPGL